MILPESGAEYDRDGRDAAMRFLFRSRKRTNPVTLADLNAVKPLLVDAQDIEMEALRDDNVSREQIARSLLPPVYHRIVVDILGASNRAVAARGDRLVAVINGFNRIVRLATEDGWTPSRAIEWIDALYLDIQLLTLFGFSTFGSVVWEMVTAVRMYRTAVPGSPVYGRLYVPHPLLLDHTRTAWRWLRYPDGIRRGTPPGGVPVWSLSPFTGGPMIPSPDGTEWIPCPTAEGTEAG